MKIIYRIFKLLLAITEIVSTREAIHNTPKALLFLAPIEKKRAFEQSYSCYSK